MSGGKGSAESPVFKAHIKKDGDVHIPFPIMKSLGLTPSDWTTLEILPSKPPEPTEAQSHELELRHQQAEADELGDNTFKYYLPLWMKNFAGNLTSLKGRKTLSAVPKVKDGTWGLVCGAGPSFAETDFALLREFEGVIVATNKTLIPLLKHEVVPDWVCALDGLPEVFRSFNDPVLKKYKDVVNFLGPSVLHPKVVKFVLGWAKECYWGNPHIPTAADSDRWNLNVVLELMNGLELLRHGGNVGTTAFLLAKSLECNPVGMLGFDMCFHPDKTWTRDKAIDFEYIYNPDNQEVMAIDPPFKAYISILTSVTDLAWNEDPPVVTVNLTPRGVLHSSGFFPNVRLKDFVSRRKEVVTRAKRERAKTVKRIMERLVLAREARKPIFRAEY